MATEDSRDRQRDPFAELNHLGDELFRMLRDRKTPLLVNDLATDKHFPWLAEHATRLLAVPLQRFDQTLGCLFALFCLTRRLVASPFGMALQGIRENSRRMQLVGAPVLRHLVVAYGLASAIAGIAGALSAQTNAFVGLEVLSLNTSIDGLVMLVLGGVGHLYGGLVGAPVYMFVQHFAREWNPYYWMFLIGALLIIVVRFSRRGLIGLLDDLLAPARQRLRR